MKTEIESGFSIYIEYDGFVAGKFPEDKPVNYSKPQGCWTNECWAVTPQNKNNPVLFSFYSKDKNRITDVKIMAIVGDMNLEDLAKIYNSKFSPIFYVCWDDFLPPCGMFMLNGSLSYTWKFYCVFGKQK